MNNKIVKIFVTLLMITLFILLIIFTDNKNNNYNLGANISTYMYGTTVDSNYKFNVDSNIIGSISDFNTSDKGLDTETDYIRSTLEYNNKEDFDILLTDLFDESELSSLENKYCYKQDSNCVIHTSQPRIIKTKNSKYILTFHITTKQIYLNYSNSNHDLGNNGLDVYYTVSSDLKNWTKPKSLFVSDYKEGKGINNDWIAYGNVFPFMVELNDGRILALVARHGLGKYAYQSASAFNKNGIYIRYGKVNSNNTITWTNESQIYKGLCYDPTAIEVSNNELQVYFTSLAPVVYYQSEQAKTSGYYAVTSSVHNSSGVAMISYLKDANGNYTIPSYDINSVTDSLKPYAQTNKNPYSAYRIIQSYVATKDNPNIPYDFKTGKLASNGLNVYGFIDNNKVIQMGDGMASPLILHNGKMVMPLETTYINDESGVAHMSLGISLAYSTPTSVKIGNNSKTKYWLDVSNQRLLNALKSGFTTEKQVYNNIGLNDTEVGPKQRSAVVYKGSGPDIVQFPSGETVLSYHNWPSFQFKIGNKNAEFKSETSDLNCYTKNTYKDPDKANENINKKISNDTYCANINIVDYNPDKYIGGGIDFGGIYVDQSHRLLATESYRDSKGSHIKISKYYLNHSIDSYSDGLSKENDDALFIGSDTKDASETIRSYHDKDYLYFVFDRLDNKISSNDSNGIRIHSDILNYKNKKYNYIWISFNNNKISRAVVGYEGQFDNISEFVTGKFITASNGYKVIIKIKKNDQSKGFSFINSNTKKVDIFAGFTKGNYYDILEGTSESDMSTWLHVNLKEPKIIVDIPNTPADKTFNGKSQAPGIRVPENTSVVNNNVSGYGIFAGTYTTELKLNDTNKYVWSDGTTSNKVITWKIVKSNLNITTSNKEFNYTDKVSINDIYVSPGLRSNNYSYSYNFYTDSSCKNPFNGKTDSSVSVKFPSTASVINNISISNVSLQPGVYYYKVSVSETYDTYASSSECKKITINEVVLNEPKVISYLYYSRKEQSSGISCPNGSVASGTLKATNIGTYTQTCKLSSSNYKWKNTNSDTVSIEWKIIPYENNYNVVFKDGNNTLYSVKSSKSNQLKRPNDPQKENYRFDNWYNESDFKTLYDFSKEVNKNTTIYAKFIPQVTLSIDSNGGINNGSNNIKYDINSKININELSKKIKENIIAPSNSYFDYIMIDDKKYDNEYVISKDASLKVIWFSKGTNYKITEGGNYLYMISSNEDITIKSEGDINKLIDIEIDSKVIDEINYTLKEGSTIVTFKKEYLETLSEGNHDVEFIYSDGYSKTIIQIVKDEKANPYDLYLIIIPIVLLMIIIFVIFKKNKF